MIRAIGISWLFAVVVSLLNLGALWPLILTPLALVAYEPWMPFLMGPLLCGVLFALLAWMYKRSVVILNVAFWLAFFASAEAWRSVKMTPGSKLLSGAQCFEQHSFLRSLTFAAEEYQFDIHAAVVTDQRVMLWSYREMDYWEAPRNAYENLNFTTCRSAVQSVLEKNL